MRLPQRFYRFPGHTLPLLVICIACRFGLFSYAWNVADYADSDVSDIGFAIVIFYEMEKQ